VHPADADPVSGVSRLHSCTCDRVAGLGYYMDFAPGCC
jgi:hypothetical protein